MPDGRVYVRKGDTVCAKRVRVPSWLGECPSCVRSSQDLRPIDDARPEAHCVIHLVERSRTDSDRESVHVAEVARCVT
jgi:hypothetical protein